MPNWEYRTQILSSTIGRDKVRMEDLNATLGAHGKQGWEIAWFETGINLKGQPDGHLLIFKRPAQGGNETA
jgi:hypothetical protein